MSRILPLLLPLTLTLGACANPAGLAPHGTPRDIASLAAERSLAARPGGDWPTERWWTAYGDPQLDRLVAAALHGSPTLDLVRARLDKARAQAGLVAADDGPQIGANAESVRQRLSGHYIYPPGLAGGEASINRATLDFSLELDFWGRNRAALAAAVGEARAVEAEAASARLLLASAVTRSYLQLDRAHQLRAIADATVVQREKLQALVRVRQQAGLESRSELQQASGSIAAARAERSALDTQLAQLRNQLAALTGQGPDAAQALTAPRLGGGDITVPTDLPADLL
uniref:TolC family protein n=1 Tax=Zoogloea sp. TaxID=49181 RepID=UPI0035B15B1F